jgi:hypothetical protein
MHDYDSYRDYLRSPQWQRLSREVYARAGGRCEGQRQDGERCPWPGRATHHLTYVRAGRERLEDLISLCDEHHQRAHPFRRPWKGEWFRVVPQAREWCVIMLNAARWYVVLPALAPALHWDEIYHLVMVQPQEPEPCFLWPIRTRVQFPPWWEAYRNIAKNAITRWIMLGEQYHQAWQKPFGPEEPRPPDETFKEVLVRAVGTDGFINSLDHPAARRLQGYRDADD